MPDITIRASSLPGYPDCPRRYAARQFRADIKAMGYTLRDTGRSGAASVGTAVHAGAAHMLAPRIIGRDLAPLDEATDRAMEALSADLDEVGTVQWPQDTGNRNAAEQQVVRMVRAYAADIAPHIRPVLVEQRLEVTVFPGVILSGQADVLAREADAVRDLKTGKRGSYKSQFGAYSLIARTHGMPVDEVHEDFVERTSLKKPQPPGVSFAHDAAACESAAYAVLHRIIDDRRRFLEGDDRTRLTPGDPWAFPANPGSKLCGAKWCPAHGTSFCVEHKED